ncbi:hypothetical protein DRJ48_00830 [Candidatus Woesearchaeota archaeon]|nr:MAG: hypothetical protein DRJ48_00830 [Candidatus Woesearchaeota archaeon]
MSKTKNNHELIVKIGLILEALFGGYIIYQIFRILFGGSWSPENIIIALLIFSLGLTVTILRRSDDTSINLKTFKKGLIG